MKLDPNYKVPAGFEPVFNYPDGNTGVPVVGRARLPIAGERDLEFYIETQVPALPLKIHGELWHTGWDISTKYAIDASGQCWMDGAHGGSMSPVDSKYLLEDCENQEQRNGIRKVLGLPEEEPSWAISARASGWTPPADWKWKT